MALPSYWPLQFTDQSANGREAPICLLWKISHVIMLWWQFGLEKVDGMGGYISRAGSCKIFVYTKLPYLISKALGRRGKAGGEGKVVDAWHPGQHGGGDGVKPRLNCDWWFSEGGGRFKMSVKAWPPSRAVLITARFNDFILSSVYNFVPLLIGFGHVSSVE